MNEVKLTELGTKIWTVQAKQMDHKKRKGWDRASPPPLWGTPPPRQRLSTSDSA